MISHDIPSHCYIITSQLWIIITIHLDSNRIFHCIIQMIGPYIFHSTVSMLTSPALQMRPRLFQALEGEKVRFLGPLRHRSTGAPKLEKKWTRDGKCYTVQSFGWKILLESKWMVIIIYYRQCIIHNCDVLLMNGNHHNWIIVITIIMDYK
jgi:hypothetical protein